MAGRLEGGIWRTVEEHRKEGWEVVGDGEQGGIGYRNTRGWEGTRQGGMGHSW